MELAIRRSSPYKFIAIFYIAVCLFMLIPATIVFANAMTDPLVGTSTTTYSEKEVGMTGSNSNLLIDMDTPGHINPSSVSYPIMSMIPLVFLAVALLMAVKMVFEQELDLKLMLIAGILVVIALALLVNVQSSTNWLLGM